GEGHNKRLQRERQRDHQDRHGQGRALRQDHQLEPKLHPPPAGAAPRSPAVATSFLRCLPGAARGALPRRTLLLLVATFLLVFIFVALHTLIRTILVAQQRVALRYATGRGLGLGGGLGAGFVRTGRFRRRDGELGPTPGALDRPTCPVRGSL